ncbi:efflux RND transporter periplasmic adaptor subunit [Bacillus sp. T33-2]|uniref:efflux RND transporter periplasmic adaptor subunit n=1 Tax=Bacillus sp. T33-2 TaxID=2054168 RepID=UPI000C76098C|nr:efflux RND transporter periplasmic adaptor subunit [Bacillus sp. T33-2]PLR95933.1 efflux transporter periplasmic adaptor subunit [Bacillus sp. T33-2]
MQIEKTHNPKRKWIILGVITLIIIIVSVNVAVIQGKNQGGTDKLKFVKVTEKEISNTKLVSGSVAPGSKETIYADPTRGKVQEIYVQEGQQIEKGQKLFSYDNPELSIQARQLEIDKKMTNLSYEQGKSKIDSLKKEIQKVKAASKASAAEPLNGQMPEGQFQSSVTDLEAQLQEAQYQQRTTELEMEKHKLQAEELQRKQEDLIVYSSIAGIVQTVDKDAGQNASQTAGDPGKPIIEIASQEPFQVHGTLSELQKAQIQPDQPITITSKAVANKTWKGKIAEVSQYPTSDESGLNGAGATGQSTQNISYYNFKASLNSQDGLSPGYHVAIQVELPSKKMLAVPRSSIVDKEDSPYVYVMDGKKLRKQKVTTGIGDGEWTEVLDGVAAGDKVVDNPSADVRDGMEVTAE